MSELEISKVVRRAVNALLLRKLAALRELARRIGMLPIGSFDQPTVEEQARRLEENFDKVERCLDVIMSSDNPIQRAAAGLLIEMYVPSWRALVPPEVFGQVVERSAPEVTRWRTDVLERDGHRCTKCGATEKLEAHHIVRWADEPSLRVVLENGATLCERCHLEVHRGHR